MHVYFAFNSLLSMHYTDAFGTLSIQRNFEYNTKHCTFNLNNDSVPT